jgi:site-specific DNA recombinase
MRAVIYARYSSDLQREASIEDQIEVCRRFASAQGWTIVETYTDAAISGASRFRPGFQKLISDASKNKFDIVICEAIDRLGRRLADTSDLQDQLAFYKIKLFTPSLGEITTIHIAVMGMMAQMALKDLGEKTKRGQMGRVRKGRIPAGIAYGYRAIASSDNDGGAREIVPEEASVVRRIFTEYASGKTPEAIARDLNKEDVSGPEGREWSNTTIRGQNQRGTGILNNSLYRGVLEWNRCSYTKNPKTGKRVARPNPPELWERSEVSHLRIVDDTLWQRVKKRQGSIRAAQTQPVGIGIETSDNPLNRTHRSRYLLSGLLRCGCCGGDFTIINKNRFSCSTRKRKGTCDNAQSITIQEIEDRVLIGLKDRLMDPELVSAFVTGYQESVREEQEQAKAAKSQLEKRKAEIDRKIAGIFKAIEDGLYEPSMKDRLADLKGQREALEVEFTIPEPMDINVLLHPRATEIYGRWVERLDQSLKGNNPHEAKELVRSLIDHIDLTPRLDGSGLDATLYGALAQILTVCNEISSNKKRPEDETSGRLLSVVAGTGFEPVTFRL